MAGFRTLLMAAGIALLAPAAYAAVPVQLSVTQQSNYREIFAAIKAGDWESANARLEGMKDGPLHNAARAEIYLAKGSPRVELEQIIPLLVRAPEMPKAAQLARLALARGADEIPLIPDEQTLVWAGSQPRRVRPKGVKGDPIADAIEPQIQAQIVADQPAEAEIILGKNDFALSPEALAAFQQRIAWSYYLTGNSEAARQLALKAAKSGGPEWELHSLWVAGLASWRMGDCDAAAESFDSVSSRSEDIEMAAAGLYWAARADMMCGRPERVEAKILRAAQNRETFYGLLAASALGIKSVNYSELHDYGDQEWKNIASKPNIRTAIALAEIDEDSLADEYIRRQAKIGAPNEHNGLIHLANDLDLASTEYWLAHNVPRGVNINLAARYPMPSWKPIKGWRVDQSLVFAHALQESNFRASVVSKAGATGIMQVRPGTASDIARNRGDQFDPRQLTDPAINIEYGQSYIEYLRDSPSTDGLLPKIIAAYNAGPAPIAKWNEQQIDNGDPLLYIESIPYWETRGYVPIVLRNYWIYEQKSGKVSASRSALAQGLWPRFPGLQGATAIRIAPRASTSNTRVYGTN